MLELILLQVLSTRTSQIRVLSILTTWKFVPFTLTISLFFTIFNSLSCLHCFVWKRMWYDGLVGFIAILLVSKYCSIKPVFSGIVFFFGVHSCFALYSVLMNYQHTLLFCIVLDGVHHLHIKLYKIKAMDHDQNLEELHT
jgi:hypothetical protein